MAKSTGFENDARIKFVGTVYNQELLKKIREEAFAYIHGHEVGGTNPSLLEALASTKVNLLLDVGFNREVGEDAALYWEKKQNSLSELINSMEEEEWNDIIFKFCAKTRILDHYEWKSICVKYEEVFLDA